MLLSAFGRAAKEKEKNLLYNELDARKQKKEKRCMSHFTADYTGRECTGEGKVEVLIRSSCNASNRSSETVQMQVHPSHLVPCEMITLA